MGYWDAGSISSQAECLPQCTSETCPGTQTSLGRSIQNFQVPLRLKRQAKPEPAHSRLDFHLNQGSWAVCLLFVCFRQFWAEGANKTLNDNCP